MTNKKVENLPRTGIEYPFTKERRQTQFIPGHKEFEPLSEQTINNYLLEEYIKNDSERANSSLQSVVYDCIEMSPHYDVDPAQPFIDEKDLIDLPPITDQTEGLVNEPYQKRYMFNPLNLPYQLERAFSGPCSNNSSGQENTKSFAGGGSSGARGNGPRLNRYYETLKPYYKIDPDQEGSVIDKTLIFESRFESGNLKRAVKVYNIPCFYINYRGEYEYDLYLKNDYGTGGFTQWYYFKVQNMKKNQTYRFNIVNLMKPDSTYSNGMKPLVYSVKEAENTGIGWQRDGYNIAYY